MSKITKSAKNEDCTVRLIGHCRDYAESTIFAHVNGIRFGKGRAIKAMAGDIDLGAYCCSDCHDVIDGRTKTSLPDIEIKLSFFEGVLETQIKLAKKGLIKAG